MFFLSPPHYLHANNLYNNTGKVKCRCYWTTIFKLSFGQLILNSFLRAIDKSSPWVIGTRCYIVFVTANMLKPVVFALVENSYWLLVIGCYHFHFYS